MTDIGPGTLVRVSGFERQALSALWDAYASDIDFCYLTFKGIYERSGLPLNRVRRAVRGLARKRLAEFGKGLSTEDGDFFGSGYRLTEEGAAVFRDLVADPPKELVDG